jgi:hypothetical protein
MNKGNFILSLCFVLTFIVLIFRHTIRSYNTNYLNTRFDNLLPAPMKVCLCRGYFLVIGFGTGIFLNRQALCLLKNTDSQFIHVRIPGNVDTLRPGPDEISSTPLRGGANVRLADNCRGLNAIKFLNAEYIRGKGGIE